MTAFVWPIRVYYEDTDSAGVVYYANYLRFLERARTEYLRAHNIEQTQVRVDNGVVFAVRALQLQYVQALRFDDLVEVTLEIRNAGRASIDFYQTIRSVQADPVIYCTADVKIACVGVQNFRPQRIPPYIRKVIENDLESVDR